MCNFKEIFYMNELQQLLLSSMPLWITVDGYRKLMLTAFPLTGEKKSENTNLSSDILEYLKNHTMYQWQTHCAISKLMMSVNDDINITDEYSSEELQDNTIAYHRVWGPVLADSYWHFSSKQLEKDIIAAEANPSITSHLIHVNSPGGEAWYLDRLSETMRAAQKPMTVIYESTCCSAAYHIACHGRNIYAMTNNDFVGCIGTMCSFYDFQPFFEKLGIKKVEAKATNSTLKNKVSDDLIDGKPENYIKNILDPLNNQFLAEVKSQRKKICNLDNSAPVLQGETYYTDDAIEIGLADGKKSFNEAVAESAELGKEYSDSLKLKNSTYNFV